MDNTTERVDERDTMFARAARRRGTSAYEEYYARHPELKEPDDRIRAKPVLCSTESRHFDPELSPLADSLFVSIPTDYPDPDLVARLAERLKTGSIDQNLRHMARESGAIACGVAKITAQDVYTHKGRHDQDYGLEVQLDHPNALVFLVEMNFEAMQHAPKVETIYESALQYKRAAKIARMLAAALESAGYSASAQYDAHYETILVSLAVSAGLGELGRHNILIADRVGTRVRIGAVTTDAPLTPNTPISLGAASFCEICKKCSDNCPPKALDGGCRKKIRGIQKWPTNDRACYSWWRTIGTDCGICMVVCPFSHRNNWFHNGVRFVIRKYPALHHIALWLDDIIYGRRWSPSK